MDDRDRDDYTSVEIVREQEKEKEKGKDNGGTKIFSNVSIISPGAGGWKGASLHRRKNQVIKDLNLTEADLAELLPSERQTIFSNRIGWCRTYLKKAGLIESPSRAHFVITAEGKRILDTVDVITDETLRAFPSFVAFKDGVGSSRQEAVIPDNSDETPQETLERVHGELNKVLKDELLTRIHQNPPEFFEKLVVELMERMGYGRGEVTQRSRDEGIDGIVYQDKLGFDVIYVQAKRYDMDKTVGRPELQKFGGQFRKRAQKGCLSRRPDFRRTRSSMRRRGTSYSLTVRNLRSL